MARALIIFSIIFLIVTIFLMIFGDFEKDNSRIELSAGDLHRQNLFSKVYSIKKIDSLTASYNFYFTERNRTLIPADIKL